MERFKFSSQPSKYVRRVVKTRVVSGLELDVPLEGLKKKTNTLHRQDDGEADVFEHLVDQNGRWITH